MSSTEFYTTPEVCQNMRIGQDVAYFYLEYYILLKFNLTPHCGEDSKREGSTFGHFYSQDKHAIYPFSNVVRLFFTNILHPPIFYLLAFCSVSSQSFRYLC